MVATAEAPNSQRPSPSRRSSCIIRCDTRGVHRACPPTAAKGSRGRGGARRHSRQHRRGGDRRPGCRLNDRGRRRQSSCRPRRRPCSRRNRQKRNCRPPVAASTSDIAASIGASFSDDPHEARPPQGWGKRRVTSTLTSPLGLIAPVVRLRNRHSPVTLEQEAATPATQDGPSVQLLLRVSTVKATRP